MRKRKSLNKVMVVYVVMSLVMMSLLLGNFSNLGTYRSEKKQDALMNAVDSITTSIIGVTFPNKELMLSEMISDYDMYVNPKYMAFRNTEKMLSELSEFNELSKKEKRKVIREQEMKAMSVRGICADMDEITLEEEKLAWMKIIEKGIEPYEVGILEGRIKAVRDSLLRMEKKSFGYRYIIDAANGDSSVIRFIMVAPEKYPNALTMAGGRMMSMAEKEEELNEKARLNPLNRLSK